MLSLNAVWNSSYTFCRRFTFRNFYITTNLVLGKMNLIRLLPNMEFTFWFLIWYDFLNLWSSARVAFMNNHPYWSGSCSQNLSIRLPFFHTYFKSTDAKYMCKINKGLCVMIWFGKVKHVILSGKCKVLYLN